MINKLNRYDPDNLPLSEKTREGLTPNSIDQLKAISVMLSLQDDVYEDMFKKLFVAIADIKKILSRHKEILEDHEKRIGSLEEKVDKLIA